MGNNNTIEKRIARVAHLRGPRRTALSAQGSQATNKGSINRTGDNGAGVGETTRLLGDDHGEVAGWDGAGNGGIEEVEEDGDADSASRVPISCLDDGGVVLYLNDLRLTELPSSVMRTCQHIHGLVLLENDLATLPPDFNMLSNLQTLNCISNDFSTWPDAVFGCVSLREINFSLNDLSSIPPEIGNLTNLQALYVASNKIKRVPDELFTITGLQRLSFYYNPLSELPPSIRNLSELCYLDVAGTVVSKLEQGTFLTRKRVLEAFGVWVEMEEAEAAGGVLDPDAAADEAALTEAEKEDIVALNVKVEEDAAEMLELRRVCGRLQRENDRLRVALEEANTDIETLERELKAAIVAAGVAAADEVVVGDEEEVRMHVEDAARAAADAIEAENPHLDRSLGSIDSH